MKDSLLRIGTCICFATITVGLFAIAPAEADQIQTRVELDAMLAGGEEFLEDFEEVSLHDGTVVGVPNPFNNVTGAPFGWGGLIPGITYSSTNFLQVRAAGINFLEGSVDLTIEFDDPQFAIGFDSYGSNQTITLFHDENVIGVLEFDTTPGFVGWQDIVVGITSVRIETSGGSSPFSRINDVAWGRVAIPAIPPYDLNVIRGFHVSGDIFDVTESDDSYLQYNPGFTLNPMEPPVWTEFQGTLPTDEPLTLAFLLEAHANTPGLVQTIEIFNYDTNSYEEINLGLATTSDSTVVVAAEGNVRRFVETDSANVRARIAWKAPGLVSLFPWTVSMDQVAWLVTTE
jgi:hypothetical protein